MTYKKEQRKMLMNPIKTEGEISSHIFPYLITFLWHLHAKACMFFCHMWLLSYKESCPNLSFLPLSVFF